MERDGATLRRARSRDAQRRGFAEADPSADVDGHDAAAKLLLLSRLAFDAPLLDGRRGRPSASARVQPTTSRCAALLGGSVKLVAHAQRDGDDGDPVGAPHGGPRRPPSARRRRRRERRADHAPTSPGRVSVRGHRRRRRQHRQRGGVRHRRHRAEPARRLRAVARVGGQRRRRRGGRSAAATSACACAAVADAAQLVLQALEDRGLTVDGVDACCRADGGAQQLAVITGAAAARHAGARLRDARTRCPRSTRSRRCMDCVGPG